MKNTSQTKPANGSNAAEPFERGRKILADTAEAPPAAEPVKPTPAAAPVKPPPVYYQSDASQVAYLLERSEPKEREFFHHLMDDWETSAYTLTEAAFLNGADTLGIKWIAEIEDIIKENDTFQGLRFVMLMDGWLARFLRRVLKSYDHKNPPTPDDVAETLNSYLLEFQYEIRDARKLIENHPETVARDIQMAIQKRPELVA